MEYRLLPSQSKEAKMKMKNFDGDLLIHLSGKQNMQKTKKKICCKEEGGLSKKFSIKKNFA